MSIVRMRKREPCFASSVPVKNPASWEQKLPFRALWTGRCRSAGDTPPAMTHTSLFQALQSDTGLTPDVSASVPSCLARRRLLGAALGTALLVAGYEGWKKAWALAQAALFLIFTSLIISSMPYFGKAVLVSRARGACEKAAPGCAGNLYSLDKAGRERLAPQLAALLDSPDRLTRIGALYAMAYIPEECSACVPRLAELAGTAGEDEFDAVMGLIDKMGPAAAGAAPALEARLSGAEGRERYRLEAALKVLRAPASAPAQ